MAKQLTTHNGVPAVFYQSAPGDTDEGWDGGAQYPRISFMIYMQGDAERQSSGQLVLDSMSIDTGPAPEEIESAVMALLQDVFMTPDDGIPCCLAWARSDGFSENTTEDYNGIQGFVGVTTTFDVFSFPRQLTTTPDPIAAVGNYLKAQAAGATLIGTDKLPDYYTATAKGPAFYARLEALGKDRVTNAVAWMTANIAVHIFAPTSEARLAWLRILVDHLACDEEMTLSDGSPLFLLDIQADSSAAYTTTGQLHISTKYGILRQAPGGGKTLDTVTIR